MWFWKKKRIVESIKEIKSEFGPIITKLATLEPDKIYVMKITANVQESVIAFMEANKDILIEKKITILFIGEGMELYEIEKRILVSRN
jgi:hypothetical protein